jgi:hypothetical protein
MEAKKPEKLSGGKITFNGLENGDYRVELVGAWTGESTEGTARVENG